MLDRYFMRYFMTFQRIAVLSYQGSGRPKASEEVTSAYCLRDMSARVYLIKKNPS
jgi:hypothetical protein